LGITRGGSKTGGGMGEAIGKKGYFEGGTWAKKGWVKIVGKGGSSKGWFGAQSNSTKSVGNTEFTKKRGEKKQKVLYEIKDPTKKKKWVEGKTKRKGGEKNTKF